METNPEINAQLELYLDDLDRSQTQLTELMRRQQLSLASPDPAEIDEFNNRGLHVLETFQKLVDRRAGLLSQAQKCGYAAQNLEGLARILGWDDSRAERIQRLKIQGNLLVQTSFSQWVACQKATLHCRQLIQIIANGGQKTLPTASGKGPSQGGAILDASV